MLNQEIQRYEITRRKFLALSGVGVGTALGGSLLAQLQAIAAPPIGNNDGVLVMIYLGGGNDPLNTLVPFTSNAYKSLRPNLYLSPDSSDPLRVCTPITNQFGVHSSMTNIAALYQSGKVAFIPGAGYSGQDLSHFSSAAQYMYGWGGSGRVTSGWAGRFLDTFADSATESTRGITINGSIPPAITGTSSRCISLPTYISDAYNANAQSEVSKFCFNDIANFTGESSYTIPSSIAKNTVNALNLPSQYGSAYPDLTGLNNPSYIERNLAISAGIINADLGARVIHVIQDGYDTHTGQLSQQSDLLHDLDSAIGYFFANLNSKFSSRVTIMVYSEFGRRAQENGTGTDHGRAALMMLIGNTVKGGIATPYPSLTSLDNNGNLIDTVDFRQVYAEIVSQWMKSDEVSIIGNSYNDIGLFTSGPTSATTTTTMPLEKLPGVIRTHKSSIPTRVSSLRTERDLVTNEND